MILRTIKEYSPFLEEALPSVLLWHAVHHTHFTSKSGRLSQPAEYHVTVGTGNVWKPEAHSSRTIAACPGDLTACRNLSSSSESPLQPTECHPSRFPRIPRELTGDYSETNIPFLAGNSLSWWWYGNPCIATEQCFSVTWSVGCWKGAPVKTCLQLSVRYRTAVSQHFTEKIYVAHACENTTHLINIQDSLTEQTFQYGPKGNQSDRCKT